MLLTLGRPRLRIRPPSGPGHPSARRTASAPSPQRSTAAPSSVDRDAREDDVARVVEERCARSARSSVMPPRSWPSTATGRRPARRRDEEPARSSGRTGWPDRAAEQDGLVTDDRIAEVAERAGPRRSPRPGPPAGGRPTRRPGRGSSRGWSGMIGPSGCWYSSVAAEDDGTAVGERGLGRERAERTLPRAPDRSAGSAADVDARHGDHLRRPPRRTNMPRPLPPAAVAARDVLRTPRRRRVQARVADQVREGRRPRRRPGGRRRRVADADERLVTPSRNRKMPRDEGPRAT